MYVVDTNVISELAKVERGRADPKVVAWFRPLPVSSLFLSAITIVEIEMGVLAMERRDVVQGRSLRHWLEHSLLAAFAGRILPVDLAAARCCAPLHVPNRRPDRDALIAATALAHGMSVVTRNTADFAGTGVPLLDPWRDPPAA